MLQSHDGILYSTENEQTQKSTQRPSHEREVPEQAGPLGTEGRPGTSGEVLGGEVTRLLGSAGFSSQSCSWVSVCDVHEVAHLGCVLFLSFYVTLQ